MRSPKFFRFFVLIVGLILALGPGDLVPASAEGTIRPQRLAVYYGAPSRVNTAYGNVKTAAAAFAQYDVVIFNQGLEEQTHSDHARTMEIIDMLHQDYDTKVFGYLDGVSWKSSWSITGIPEATWNEHSQMWREMGVDGIFIDRFGYDWGVTRGAQNTMLDAVHDAGLDAFVNSWFIDHTFSDKPDSRYRWGNPGRVPSHIRSTDRYLLESFVIIEGGYDVCDQPQGDSWLEKADKAFAYRQTFGSAIWTMTTANQLGAGDGSPADIEAKLDYAWYATTMYGFDGFGWTEPQFSASGHALNLLPWRPRPNPNMPDGVGATFLDDVQHNGNVHTRSTDTGRFQVICEDAERHEASFCSVGRYDMNGDGMVDLDDVNIVLAASIYYNTPYDPMFDLVPDGVIDIADISEIILHFGESC